MRIKGFSDREHPSMFNQKFADRAERIDIMLREIAKV